MSDLNTVPPGRLPASASQRRALILVTVVVCAAIVWFGIIPLGRHIYNAGRRQAASANP